jgi:circadian clock protein KaiB
MKTRNTQKTTGKRAPMQYAFRLYVTGATPRSARAIQNLKGFCENHLKNKYEIEVVDIFQQPELAKGQHIIAAPTLVRHFPLPLRRFIGELSNVETISVQLKA